MIVVIKGKRQRLQLAKSFACAIAGAFATPDGSNKFEGNRKCAVQCASCRIWSDPDVRYSDEHAPKYWVDR